MKKNSKGLFLFLCIVLLLSTTSCQNKTVYFEDIHLGMSRDEILEVKIEWGNPPTLEEDYMSFSDVKYNDQNIDATYTFDSDDKLVHASISTPFEEKEESSGYNKLVKNVSRQYGKATKLGNNATMWKIKRNEIDEYILCLRDTINNWFVLILCTQELYDEIIQHGSKSY
ncbi:MAG: hypothetical protein ACOWWR_05085 [Eubacteriales bacterium]